jgi:hypothetical protein
MPGKIKDRTGARYGRLVAVELDSVRASPNGATMAFWRCACDCGALTVVGAKNLQSGMTKSCGCYSRDRTREVRTKHGESRGYTYNSWRAARERCYNPKCRSFHLYGGRGIAMCERWADYRNFLADMGERPRGKTLDRIDGDGNYEPENCRWATAREQASHLPHTIQVEHEGEVASLFHYASLRGVNPATLAWRVREGGQGPVEAADHILSGAPFKRPAGLRRRQSKAPAAAASR